MDDVLKVEILALDELWFVLVCITSC